MQTIKELNQYEVYRWNGERAFHIFSAGDSRPKEALCGIAFPDSEESQEYWHHWLRQSGSLSDMRKWIIATPLLNGYLCAGCHNA